MARIVWAAVFGAIALSAAITLVPLADARSFRGDLTAPSGGAPFGGDVVGDYKIQVHGGKTSIRAKVDVTAMEGYTLEWWLVDTQTGYKLSLGELQGGKLEFEQRMVNPWTYGVLVITAEPVGDLDPNPNTPVAGAALSAPFGQ